jgi:hypothetical protein
MVPEKGLDSKEGWDIGIDAKVLVDQMENFHPSLQAAARFVPIFSYSNRTQKVLIPNQESQGCQIL